MGKSINKQFLIFLGKNVRQLRDKKGLSQEKFGKMAGFHRTYIGAVERGEKNITIANLHKIAGTLGVAVKELIDF